MNIANRNDAQKLELEPAFKGIAPREHILSVQRRRSQYFKICLYVRDKMDVDETVAVTKSPNAWATRWDLLVLCRFSRARSSGPKEERFPHNSPLVSFLLLMFLWKPFSNHTEVMNKRPLAAEDALVWGREKERKTYGDREEDAGLMKV